MTLFYSNKSIIWDSQKNKILCKFTDGEFQTKDSYIIEKLKALNFEYKEEEKKNGKSKNK